MPLAIGVATTAWFTIGCILDLRVFFRRIKEETVDLHDDGVVDEHDDNDGGGSTVMPKSDHTVVSPAVS